MNALTNGNQVLDAIPLTQRGEATLGHGPLNERIAACAVNAWWGRFEAGEILEAHVQGCGAEDLLLEVLDENFRILGFQRTRARQARVEVLVQRTGVHHVRVRNLAGEPNKYLLGVSRTLTRDEVRPRIQRRPVSAWFEQVRRAAASLLA